MDKKYFIIPTPVCFCFALAIALRFYAAYFSAIINLDGIIYVHLARAIYYGQLEQIANCALLTYLPPNPFLIAAGYGIFHDWELAARAVSFLSGIGVLVPLYLLAKRFFSLQVSVLVLVFFALNPIFVSQSAEVLKDALSWFFLAWALYFFIAAASSKKMALNLGVSSLCFMLAAWGRVEFGVFYLFSAAYLLLARPDQGSRIKRFFSFTVLAVSAVLIVLFGMKFFFGDHVSHPFRLADLLQRGKLYSGWEAYEGVRQQLAELQKTTPAGSSFSWFLPEARNTVWLIAAGSLLNRFCEAFFYPYLILFLIGWRSWRQVLGDYRCRYLALLAVVGSIILYWEMVTYWIVEYRYVAGVIIPSFIFLGFGLADTLAYLQKRWRISGKAAVTMVMLWLLAFGLGKNLQHPYADKEIYKKMGLLIAEQGQEQTVKNVAGFSGSPLQQWVSFYGNLRIKGAPCPHQHFSLSADGSDLPAMLDVLRKQNIDYFIADEASWRAQAPSERGGNLELFADPRLELVSEGWHKDVGKIFLYKTKW